MLSTRTYPVRLLAPILGFIMGSAACGKGPERVSTGPKTAAAIANSPAEIKVEYQPLDVPSVMKAGTDVPIRFEAKNVGSATWSGNGGAPFRFGYHWSDPDRRGGDWNAIVWDDGVRGLISDSIPPGGRAVISIKVRAPNTPAPSAKLIIAPLLEPNGWTTETALVVTVDVK
jgi:hypothetical protein